MSDKYLDFLVVHLVIQLEQRIKALKQNWRAAPPGSGFDFLGLIPQKDAGHFF
jgi:hypothetical protein